MLGQLKKFLIVAAVAAPLSFYTVGMARVQRRDRSLVFIGEKQSFERELDAEVDYPITSAMQQIAGVLWKQLLAGKAPSRIDALAAADQLIAAHPRLFIGYEIKALLLRQCGRRDESDALAGQALAVATANAALSQRLVDAFDLRPPAAATLQLTPPWPARIEELAAGQIWTLLCPHLVRGSTDAPPVALQAAVVRLNERGELLIVNPAVFDRSAVDFINATGTVVALATTTSGHGDALAAMAAVWPHAKLYYTDAAAKHDHPELPWAGPVPDFDGLFQLLPLRGHLFHELALLHRPSKILLGITDMAFPSRPAYDAAVGPDYYYFALGMNRGVSRRREACYPQSYHWLFTADRAALRSSVQDLLAADWQLAVCGHGGTLTKTGVAQAFAYLLDDPAWQLTAFEKIYMPLAWAVKHDLLGALFWSTIEVIKQQSRLQK